MLQSLLLNYLSAVGSHMTTVLSNSIFYPISTRHRHHCCLFFITFAELEMMTGASPLRPQGNSNRKEKLNVVALIFLGPS